MLDLGWSYDNVPGAIPRVKLNCPYHPKESHTCFPLQHTKNSKSDLWWAPDVFQTFEYLVLGNIQYFSLAIYLRASIPSLNMMIFVYTPYTHTFLVQLHFTDFHSWPRWHSISNLGFLILRSSKSLLHRPKTSCNAAWNFRKYNVCVLDGTNVMMSITATKACR